MGLLSGIFGSKPKSTVQTRSTLNPKQQELLDILFTNISQPEQVTPFTGRLTAPLSEGEQTSLRALEERALAIARGDPLLSGASDAILSAFDTSGSDFDEFFESTISRPLMESFREDILPAIDRKHSKNFFTGGRRASEARATEDLLDSLVNARGRLAFETREADRTRALTAAGLAPGLASAGTTELLGILASQALPREVEQLGLNAAYQEFLRQQQEKDVNINQILAALDLDTLENIATVTGGSSGLLGSFLGGPGGGALGGLLGSFFPPAGKTAGGAALR